MNNDDGFFHITNRGVDDRKIFLCEEDYLRFVYSLSDFNEKNLVSESYNTRRQHSSAMRKPKNELVDILAWTLMPNHYHIFISEKIDGGASLFSKKISSSYTQHFNLKNSRKGVLFQGRSKIIPIDTEEHFIHIPYYIFSNPISLIESGWKENGTTKNPKKVIKFLENYRWSSFQDMIGKENFPFIVNKKLFFELFDTNEKEFQKFFLEWIEE